MTGKNIYVRNTRIIGNCFRIVFCIINRRNNRTTEESPLKKKNSSYSRPSCIENRCTSKKKSCLGASVNSCLIIKIFLRTFCIVSKLYFFFKNKLFNYNKRISSIHEINSIMNHNCKNFENIKTGVWCANPLTRKYKFSTSKRGILFLNRTYCWSVIGSIAGMTFTLINMLISLSI